MDEKSIFLIIYNIIKNNIIKKINYYIKNYLEQPLFTKYLEIKFESCSFKETIS